MRRLVARASGVVLGLTLGLVVAAPAFGQTAAPPPDEVLLVNGGRLRGVVMEDDPAKGVTIRLLDGTTKKVVRSEVMRVRYADALPAAQPSTAPPAAASVAPALAPVAAPGEQSAVAPLAAPPGLAPPLGAAGFRRSGSHHVAALWVTGLALWSATYVATIGITAGVAQPENKGKAIGEAAIPFAGPFVGLADGNDVLTGSERAGIITSLVLQQVGLALFVMGATISVSDGDSRASVVPLPVASGGGAALHLRF